MPKLSTDIIVDLLKKSGLIEPDRWDALLSQAAPAEAEDGPAFVNRLVELGAITPWQAQQLLDGRYKGFFLGKYKLLGHLGSGGMSSVYLAEHSVMHTRRAIKVLPKSRVDDSSYLARFHREARAAGALEHPNIARAYDVDNDGKIHYLVMEYVDGRDLQELVEETGPLAYELAADYIRQAADGLVCAHQAGVIHRDIKPANLLVNSQGVVKLLDLGLALSTDEKKASLTLAFDEKVLGTADYLSPEQAIDSHRVDARSDLYSLGGTLYFLLTGHPPFPEGSLTQRLLFHQTKEPADIRADRPDCPASLVEICRKMMAKSPDERFPSAGEVRDTLAHWLAGGHQAALTNVSGRMAAVLNRPAPGPGALQSGSGSRTIGTKPPSSVVRLPGEGERRLTQPTGDTLSGSGRSTVKSSTIPTLAPLPEDALPGSAPGVSGVGNSQVVGRLPGSSAGTGSSASRAKPPGLAGSSPGVRPGSSPGVNPASGVKPPAGASPAPGSGARLATGQPVASPPKPLVDDLLSELDALEKKPEPEAATRPTTAPAFRHTGEKNNMAIPLVIGALLAGVLVFGVGAVYLIVTFFKYQP